MKKGFDFPPQPHEEKDVDKTHIRKWKKEIAEDHPDKLVGLPEEEQRAREERFKENMSKLQEIEERLGLSKKSPPKETGVRSIPDMRSSVPTFPHEFLSETESPEEGKAPIGVQHIPKSKWESPIEDGVILEETQGERRAKKEIKSAASEAKQDTAEGQGIREEVESISAPKEKLKKDTRDAPNPESPRETDVPVTVVQEDGGMGVDNSPTEAVPPPVEQGQQAERELVLDTPIDDEDEEERIDENRPASGLEVEDAALAVTNEQVRARVEQALGEHDRHADTTGYWERGAPVKEVPPEQTDHADTAGYWAQGAPAKSTVSETTKKGILSRIGSIPLKGAALVGGVIKLIFSILAKLGTTFFAAGYKVANFIGDNISGAVSGQAKSAGKKAEKPKDSGGHDDHH